MFFLVLVIDFCLDVNLSHNVNWTIILQYLFLIKNYCFHRMSSDSEIQTQVQQGSASTQTSYDEDSEWYKYTRSVEEYRESSEKVRKQTRQSSDSETQTDMPVEDDLGVLVTTHEGEIISYSLILSMITFYPLLPSNNLRCLL